MRLFRISLALMSGLAMLSSCTGQPAKATRVTPTVNISDKLPTGAKARIGTVRLRDVGLQSLAVSPDGSVVVSGGMLTQSSPKTATAWSLVDGKLQYSIGDGDVFVAISPDSKTLATSGKYGDEAIRLWDLQSGQFLREIAIPALKGNGELGRDWSHGIGRTTFSADGHLIAVETWWEDTRGMPEYPRYFSVQIIDLSTGKIAGTLSIPQDEAYGFGSPNVVFAPDSKSLALIGGKDRTVYLFDVATSDVLGKVGNYVVDCKFSRDGKWLVLAERWSLRLIDLKTLKDIRSFSGFETHYSGGPVPISLSPDQRLLAAGGGYGDALIRLWEVSTGKLLREFPRYYRATATSLDFTPDGKYLVCGCGKFVHVLNVEDGREDALNDTPRGDLCGVFFSPDGKTLALCGDDRGVRIHDVATGRRLLWFHRGEFVRGVAFTPDGSLAATVGQTIRLWKAATGEPVRMLQENLVHVKGDAWSITSAAFLANGKQLLTASDFGVMQLWDVATGREIRRYDQPLDNDHHPARVRGIVIFPDETKAAVVSNGVLVWDLSSGEMVHRFEGGYGNLDVGSPLAISPDGLTLAFETHLRSDKGEPQIVALQQVHDQQPLRYVESLAPNRRDLLNVSIAFSPNGQLLATGGGDCLVHVWDFSTGNEVGRFDGHRDFVSGVTFSPDGTTIASSSHDGTVLIWDVSQITRTKTLLP